MSKFSQFIDDGVDSLQKFIHALNGVDLNVWAVVLLLMALKLYLAGHEGAAGAFTTGAFAILRGNSVTRQPQTPDQPKS